MNETTSSTLLLNGIDGGNPLGFLAAVGTALTAASIWPNLRVFWNLSSGIWNPILSGCTPDREMFLDSLSGALQGASLSPFEIDNKLPYSVTKFTEALAESQRTSSRTYRRECDFLAAFGTEVFPDKNGIFRDSRLRMVRSGDSKGQGLPVYARSIRRATDVSHLQRTLFQPWDYRDSGFSMRWGPLEDQRYALRWRDPSKSTVSDGPGTMLGANSLAIEAMQLFPVQPATGAPATSGFHRTHRREEFFIWPIWTVPIDLATLRSLITLPLLFTSPLARDKLSAMGIPEVFKSQRIAQNQYYSNFAPATPA